MTTKLGNHRTEQICSLHMDVTGSDSGKSASSRDTIGNSSFKGTSINLCIPDSEFILLRTRETSVYLDFSCSREPKSDRLFSDSSLLARFAPDRKVLSKLGAHGRAPSPTYLDFSTTPSVNLSKLRLGGDAKLDLRVTLNWI